LHVRCLDIGFDVINWWEATIISVGIGGLVALFTHLWAGGAIKRYAVRLHEQDIEKAKTHTDILIKSGKSLPSDHIT
jgi:hypothetical protein